MLVEIARGRFRRLVSVVLVLVSSLSLSSWSWVMGANRRGRVSVGEVSVEPFGAPALGELLSSDMLKSPMAPECDHEA